jgi:hypothetical protein
MFGLTPHQRVTVGSVAALTIHSLLLPFWFAIGLVWAGTPTKIFQAIIMNVYGYTAVFGWPVVAVVLAIGGGRGAAITVRSG